MDGISEYQEDALAKAAKMAPDDMRQIPRELTLLRGGVASLHAVVNDLLGGISPILRQEPEDEARLTAETPTRHPVTTEVSQALREIYDEVSAIETSVARVRNRLEL